MGVEFAESREAEGSRRALLAAGVGVGLLGLSAAGKSQAAPLKPETYWVSPARRLLRRIHYGVTPSDVDAIAAVGFTTYLEQQLNAQTINDLVCEAEVANRFPRISMPVATLGQDFSIDWRTIQQIGESMIYRAVNSRKQLLQRMVEFWYDHFNIHIDKAGGWLGSVYDRDVIRQHALGKFPDLLRAVANSPAMLVYLDNTENWGDFGNINYARELLELHTLGVDGGYTPADIRNVQRCFSGWGMQWDSGAPDYGQFKFWEWGHSTLPKTVLGQNITPGMKSEGDQVLTILANHPSTARFLARKLCRFWLNYNPPASLVDQVAAEYTATGGDIKAMLRKILTSANLMAAPPKYKRPWHLMMGSLRAMRATFVGEQWSLRYEHLFQAGMLPQNWIQPDGYPDKLDFWSGLILPRWNFALMLPQNYVWGVEVNLPTLLAGANTPATIAERINHLLFAGEMIPADKQDVQDFLAAGWLDEYRIKAGFAIALASPSNQWC